MSITSIRAALEAKLNAMTPALATVWQNVSYTPITGTPYQACFLLPATPSNLTLGDGFYREQGIFQISLFYPLLEGAQDAEARAQLIRTAFKRGTAMISGSVSVLVDTTPEIGQGRADDDRWHVPVKIRFSAGIIA